MLGIIWKSSIGSSIFISRKLLLLVVPNYFHFCKNLMQNKKTLADMTCSAQ